MGLPLATYTIYVVHMSLMVPMLTLEVPFGKWAQMAYRPFAIYRSTVRDKAIALQASHPVAAAVN
jgi:hypothetical protein